MARKRTTKAKKVTGGEVPFVGARRVGGRIVVTLAQDGKPKTKTYAARRGRVKKSSQWMDDPAAMDALVKAFGKAVKDAERTSRASSVRR